MERKSVLFLCTGNSCRSQMAEGWARAILGDVVDSYSAGVETHGLNPGAVRTMREAGVDISGQKSQHVDDHDGLSPDLVVTVCDHAAEVCPIFPGSKRTLHHRFEDPAKATGTPVEIEAEFRRVRDQIRAFVEDQLPGELGLADRALVRSWPRHPSEDETDFTIFRVRRFQARSPRTGQDRPFTLIDTSDWVNVFAETTAGDVVLVRQWRHGRGHVTWELPGGIIDASEDPAVAATRELREETGFEGDAPEYLGTVEPNPAIQTNRCHTYLIRNARRVAELSLDPGEDIVVETLPRRELATAVRDGRIRHALVVCALWWADSEEPVLTSP